MPRVLFDIRDMLGVHCFPSVLGLLGNINVQLCVQFIVFDHSLSLFPEGSLVVRIPTAGCHAILMCLRRISNGDLPRYQYGFPSDTRSLHGKSLAALLAQAQQGCTQSLLSTPISNLLEMKHTVKVGACTPNLKGSI